MKDILFNEVGNFSLQCAMKRSKDAYYDYFIDLFKANFYELKKTEWGKKATQLAAINFPEIRNMNK